MPRDAEYFSSIKLPIWERIPARIEAAFLGGETMPDHPEPTTNIGRLLGKVLQYEAVIQRVIDDLESVKTLSVGGTSQQPTLKGIHAHGHTYEWELGTIRRTG